MKLQVPGEGPQDARIMIVGEAPGANEAKHGKPFIGQSGTLLNNTLAQVGIARSSCYITNVFKERPPKGDIEYFIKLSKKNPELKNGAEHHLAHFYRELAAVQPHVIIALGNTPLWALTGEKGIQKWRGSILSYSQWRDDQPPLAAKIIPTVHPATCMRTYEWRHLLHFDLRKAALEVDRPGLPQDNNEYILSPTFDESVAFIEECLKCKRVGLDIEVARREVSCISFSPSKGASPKPSHKAISIPFWSPARGHLMTPPQEAEIWRAINKLFKSGVEIIAHNGAFDFVFLYQKYGIWPEKIQDTMIAQAILWPDFSKSLAFATTMYTDMPYYKDEGKEGLLRGGGSYKERDEQFWLYNAKDGVVLPEIFFGQEQHLRRQGNLDTYKRQRDCLYPISYMSTRGMYVNLDSIDKAKKEAEKQLSIMQDEIDRAALEQGWDKPSLNPNSPKQLKEFFFITCNEVITKAQGKATTNEKALKTIARRAKRGATVASLIGDFRKLKKLSGTYYNMSFDTDGRLRSSINPVGTETGRFSSSQTIFGTGGNMQNMPKSFRLFLEPDKDYIGYEVDLSQAENRLVALFSNEEQMLHAFTTGQDIHSLTASLLFGGEADKAYQNSIVSPLGNGTRSQRYWGKLSNHALNYDMGANTASMNWEIPISQARQIVAKYHAAYPALRQWHRSIIHNARNTRTVTNAYGRTRRYLGRFDKSTHHEMFAFGPQSTVADHINIFGLLYMFRNTRDFLGVQVINQVHDSLLFQIHSDLSWEEHARIINLLRASLETPVQHQNREVILPASCTIHSNNFKEGIELDTNVTPQTLEEAYNEQQEN